MKKYGNNDFFSATIAQRWFNRNPLTQQRAIVHSLTLLFLLLCSDSRPRGLSDGGIWGRLQSQGAEGRPAGWDGSMGRHRHGPSRAGTRPQDLRLSEGAARVWNSDVSSDSSFHASGRAAAASEDNVQLCVCARCYEATSVVLWKCKPFSIFF